VGVEHGEVTDDDRNGQGDGQHSGQSTQSANEHARIGLGRHIAVSHGGHGHNRPPQSQGNALKLVVRIVLPGKWNTF